MRWKTTLWLWILCLGCLSDWTIDATGASRPEPPFPAPLGYVSDYAQILSSEWYQQIRTICQDLEERTGVEMLVVTLNSVHPLPHAQAYASRLYEAWRIGTAQQERGILLLAAVKEQQAVVVVGKNLLSLIPPQQLDKMSLTLFQPMFLSKDYGVNVYRAAVSLAAMAGEVPHHQEEKKGRRKVAFWMNVGVVLLMIYAVWRFTRPERKHPFPRWKRGEFWGIGQGGFGGPSGGFGGSTGANGLTA